MLLNYQFSFLWAQNFVLKLGSKLIVCILIFRYLNKACMIRSREKDVGPDGLAIDEWSLCTVRQVEELKVLISVLPIWSTGIMIAVIITQHSIPVVQATTMDRHLFPHFNCQQLPSPSLEFSLSQFGWQYMTGF